MGIKVGIDVGGTFTDAVAIDHQEILSKTKVPTQQSNLLDTIINALDALNISCVNLVEKITVSTTIVTNAILQNTLKPATLFLFPGTGVKVDSYQWPISYKTLTGEIDFRGREIVPPDELEWRRVTQKITVSHAAVIGKFSHRNNNHEEKFAQFLLRQNPQLKIALGHQWGKPNFYRRSLTTYLNLTVSEIYDGFNIQLTKALRNRGYSSPVFVLKGDGGVSPLRFIRPIETIYSGPAASVLGAIAQSEPGKSFVVIDIGGTTTDIGLVLSDNPLISSKGAKIGAFSSIVRSLAVRSIPVGGDSQVINTNSKIELLNQRRGPAYCLGGSYPTPTDAMRFLNLIHYGNYELAEKAIASLTSEKSKQSLEDTANTIISEMTEKIAKEVESLQLEWKDEPAYKVWEVFHPQATSKFDVILSGGGGKGLIKGLEKRLNLRIYKPSNSEISNAIGTALARPAFSYTLHLDTYLRRYRIEETGEQGEWLGSRRPHHEVKKFLQDLMNDALKAHKVNSTHIEEDTFDFFPIIQNWRTAGYIARGSIHITPGIDWRIKS